MMFRKKPALPPFRHTDGCKLIKIDPGMEIPWSEIRAGVFEAVCQCGKSYHYETVADRRPRLDPYDPATSRHLGECEHRNTTDPALLRLLLRVQDGAEPGYWWVTCASCQASWQVLRDAAEGAG